MPLSYVKSKTSKNSNVREQVRKARTNDTVRKHLSVPEKGDATGGSDPSGNHNCPYRALIYNYAQKQLCSFSIVLDTCSKTL